ncbi:MAG: hypothetical protein FWD95_17140 [Nocardioidaceae bacterium]|nr:hypothetical protein [Nocardioidaceae bacterium]
MTSSLVARLIGAVFGLVFVAVNAGAANGPWSWVLRVLGLSLFVGVLLRLRDLGEVTVQPRARAIPIYWTSVLLEVAALLVGTRLLSSHGHGTYGVALVAVVVGIHFLPFAWAFRQRAFLPLGIGLILLGAAGVAAGLLGAPGVIVALLSGVGSGLALLLYAATPPALFSASVGPADPSSS